MNRSAIFNALFALATSVGAGVFVTTSRKLKHWSDVPAPQQPALFQAQGAQTVAAPAANGLPTRWYLDASLYLYANTAGAASPEDVLNPLVDAITAKFEPNVVGAPQTLGGLVQWARVEGTIETSEGTLGDQAVVIIPIRMLAA